MAQIKGATDKATHRARTFESGGEAILLLRAVIVKVGMLALAILQILQFRRRIPDYWVRLQDPDGNGRLTRYADFLHIENRERRGFYQTAIARLNTDENIANIIEILELELEVDGSAGDAALLLCFSKRFGMFTPKTDARKKMFDDFCNRSDSILSPGVENVYSSVIEASMLEDGKREHEMGLLLAEMEPYTANYYVIEVADDAFVVNASAISDMEELFAFVEASPDEKGFLAYMQINGIGCTANTTVGLRFGRETRDPVVSAVLALQFKGAYDTLLEYTSATIIHNGLDRLRKVFPDVAPSDLRVSYAGLAIDASARGDVASAREYLLQSQKASKVCSDLFWLAKEALLVGDIEYVEGISTIGLDCGAAFNNDDWHGPWLEKLAPETYVSRLTIGWMYRNNVQKALAYLDETEKALPTQAILITIARIALVVRACILFVIFDSSIDRDAFLAFCHAHRRDAQICIVFVPITIIMLTRARVTRRGLVSLGVPDM